MAIPESQLDTWSAQGSVTQSKNTYATIKRVLEDVNAPYSDKNFTVFLQGSYGNDTNVYAESDVDVVIRLDSSFQYSLSELNDAEKTRFDTSYANVDYGYAEFKAHVIAWLKRIYGDAAQPGSKAITIQGNGTRRDADVLPCLAFRRYSRFVDLQDQSYIDGIRFYRTDGKSITNYPKRHADNCTQKHKDTGQYFKPMVRILKNMRNRMVKEGEIADGLAPSYFIEGMLWNVPDNRFGVSYEDTFVEAINWLRKADRASLTCANDIHALLRDDQPVCWNEQDFDAFLTAIVKYWQEW